MKATEDDRHSVIVVGAGPSGLAALKEMREAGLDTIAVDSREQFGGVFSPDSNTTFEYLHLTTSNMFMAFSDFPPKDKALKYWTKAEYFGYLSDYVDHFGLARYVRLGTAVRSARFDTITLQWEVTTVKAGRSSKLFADKLVVAAGANHIPFIPEQFKAFTGDLVHSAQYRSMKQARGKKILVVGTGESSADVSCSAAKVAESVTLYARRNPDTAPRYIRKFLDAETYDEEVYMEEDSHNDGRKPNEMLESVIISRASRNLPLGVWSFALQNMVKDVASKHGLGSHQDICNQNFQQAWKNDYFSSDTAGIPTKSQMFSTAAARGLVDMAFTPKIAVKGNSVTFYQPSLVGNSKYIEKQQVAKQECITREFDMIVACTGYRLNFDWITTSEPGRVGLNCSPRAWFKHGFPPGLLGQHMVFVGFARPHSGGIPPCAEMLSRYAAQIFKGNLTLPPAFAMLALEDGEREKTCFHSAPHVEVLVDYMSFMVSVAKLIGSTPGIPWTCGTDMVKHWTFPLWPCFFRSRHGSIGYNLAATKVVLDKFEPWDSLAPMPLLALQLIFSLIMPVVNLMSFVLNWLLSLLTNGVVTGGRPMLWQYKWRVSKSYFLYHNSLGFHELEVSVMQWLATAMILGHCMQKTVTDPIQSLWRMLSASKEV